MTMTTAVTSLSRRERLVLGALVSAATGFVQLAVSFTDNRPIVALLMLGAVSLAGGAAVGVLVPRIWPVFGLAACWGATMMGLAVLVGGGRPAGALIIATALAGTLAGGGAGTLVRTRRSGP